jgi:hypothetical protein
MKTCFKLVLFEAIKTKQNTSKLSVFLTWKGQGDGVKSLLKIAELKSRSLLNKNLFQTSFV